jgi:hypothetical protein
LEGGGVDKGLYGSIILLALKIKLKNESDASGCSSNLTAVGARRGFQSDIPRFPVKNPIAESKDMRMIADPELFSTLITRQVFTPALCKAGPAPHPTRPVRHPFPEKSAFFILPKRNERRWS